MEFCERCGREKRNPSILCSNCSDEFQKYMKTHPLSTYDNLVQMRKESDKRWSNFIRGDTP